MAIREIRLFGDPVLRTKSEPVKDFSTKLHSLIADLEETTNLPGRAGVAACQIGVNLRAFSYRVNEEVGHLINPEIVEYLGGQVDLEEGCLSLPEVWSLTPRYQSVRVRGQKVTGESVEIVAEGLLAQVFQHEIDHLDGMVYLDRLSQERRKEAMAALRATDWFLAK